MTTIINKVTPTGILVLSSSAPREAWLAERTKGITATDIPAILGLNKYKTAIDVWTDKIQPNTDGFEPTIGNMEAAFWGIQLEDTVAKAWADHKNVKIRRIGIIRHDELDWARASLDRLVTGCPDGKCALEVKTRSGYVGDEWDRGVPNDVRAQVAWQLMVSGLDHVHVIALIGGQRLVEHLIRLDHPDIDTDTIMTNACTLWDAVQSGQPPKLPEHLWTDAFLEAAHPDRTGEIEVEDANFLVADYEDLSNEIKELEERRARIKTQLIGALGDAEVALFEGRPFYTYKAQTFRRINTKALGEIYPDAAADDRIWSTTNTRILRIATTKEK